MRSSLLLRSLALLAVVLALLAPRLAAQDTVTVKIFARATTSNFDGSSDSAQMSLWGSLGSDDDSTTTPGAVMTCVLGTRQIQPQTSNTISIGCTNIDQGEFDVVAPPGYRVIMDGMVRTRETFTSNTSIVFQVQALGANHPGLAGIAYKVSNTAIDWRLSLGSLLNGTSAGELTLVDPGTEASWSQVFTPSALTYESTSDEVTVYRPYNVLRQIMANQVALDIVTLSSTSYEIRCYHPAQASAYFAGYSGQPLAFSGQPFVTYRIAQGATATTLTITKEVRNVTDTTSTNFPIARTEVMSMALTGSWPTHAWTGSDWTLSGQTPLSETFIQSGGSQYNRTEAIAVRVPSTTSTPNPPALSVARTYTWNPYSPIGEVLVGETVGSTNAMTAGISYYSDATQFGSLGSVNSATLPGGNWVAYDYYDADPFSGVNGGRVKYRYKPYVTAPTTASHDPYSGEVTYYEYTNDPFGVPSRQSLVETRINSVLTAQRTIAYTEFNSPTVSGEVLVRADVADNSGSTLGSPHSSTTYYREDSGNSFLRGQPDTTVAHNGATTTYTYERGTWDGTTFTSNGVAVQPSWGPLMLYLWEGSRITATTPGVPYDKLVTIRDRRALVVRTEKWSGGNLVSFANFGYDFAGHLVSRVSNNGATYTAVYDGGLKTSETDESGVVTTYLYDAADRMLVATRTGSGVIGAVATHYLYDAAGHVTEERVGWTQSGSTEQLVTTRQYDDAGRLTSETPAGLGTTTHAYDVANRTHTTTNPDGSTAIDTSYLDGRPTSKTGTATVPEYYTYGVEWDTSVRQYRQVDTGFLGSGRWKKTWADWNGHDVRTLSYLGYSDNFYGGDDQPYKTTAPGTAAKLYTYALDGTLSASGLNSNNDGSTVLNSSQDRMSTFNQMIQMDGSNTGYWLSAYTYTYLQSGSYATARTQSNTRLTGFPANRVSETQSIDVDGNITDTTVDVNRANCTATKTTTRTGVANAQYEYSIDGLPTSTLGSDGLTTSTTYDLLLRVQTVTDGRGNQTKTTYYPGTKLAYQTIEQANTSSPVVVATYHYDSMGRKDWQDDAAGSTHRIYYAYNRRGQLLRQWGPGTYPVAYAYSIYGEQVAMRTFRNPTQDFTTATWPLTDDGSDATNPNPASWTVGDITKWVYDATSGLLMEKQFPALPGQTSKRITYSYDAAGHIATRQWERTIPAGLANAGQRVTATYTYDPITGDQTGITYNDGTPAVSYTYTRAGKIDSVTDTTGVCDWVYQAYRLSCQAYDTFYGQRVFTHLYDQSVVYGRPRGFQLGATVGSNSELEQTYGFSSTTGRFDTLATKRNANATTRTFHYGYEPNTALVKTLWTDDNAFFVTRSFEANRDVLTSLETRWGQSAPTDVTDYAYQTDALYRRSSAVQTGDAFAGFGYTGATNALNENFTYNARSELTGAATALGSDPANPGTALANRQHEFNFDSIGNRNWANVTGATVDRKSYTVNALNQYTARDNPLTPFGGTQAFTYDLDGNVLTDGQWQYTWDAENRLIAMQTDPSKIGTGLIAAIDARRLEFRYDYQGRRVEKLVRNGWNGTIYSTTPLSQTRYLYDGWSLIAEYTVSGSTLTLARSYTWGLDIARSLTDAGGVGALLQIADHLSGKTYLPTYDGNGNVAALIDGSNGSVAAVYEYGPFGEAIRAQTNDATVADQPFRFSTKFYDGETGLYNYGRRFYSPSQGRFLGRDPIEEQGGLNLYGFCANNAINKWDYIGLSDIIKMGAYVVKADRWQNYGWNAGDSGWDTGWDSGWDAGYGSNPSGNKFDNLIVDAGSKGGGTPPKPRNIAPKTVSSNGGTISLGAVKLDGTNGSSIIIFSKKELDAGNKWIEPVLTSAASADYNKDSSGGTLNLAINIDNVPKGMSLNDYVAIQIGSNKYDNVVFAFHGGPNGEADSAVLTTFGASSDIHGVIKNGLTGQGVIVYDSCFGMAVSDAATQKIANIYGMNTLTGSTGPVVNSAVALQPTVSENPDDPKSRADPNIGYWNVTTPTATPGG